ncbi:tyrosine-type recombinase/integrase [Microbacterium sp. No. 7]|uniref:tyrosine-type recombinase/integrase n=2 Tax=Microbacterium sp. No. 7 TaxID=1714373 RepID=UPI0012E2AAAE|nr:tyrosine-type recombinase/integrase [Microbacterium sp. No. 7]
MTELDSDELAGQDRDKEVSRATSGYVYVRSVSQPLTRSHPWSTMHLRFVDHRLTATADLDERIGDLYSRGRPLPEGMPILLDDGWRPVEPWLTYFRIVAASADRATLRAYAYDARRFAAFLDARRTDVIHATSDDIVAYREWRLNGSERPVAHTTWQRDVVVIRGIYQLLTQTGQIQREPWITIGKSSPLRTRWTSEPDIRPLTQSQWRTFREVGLGGRTASGDLDESWRGSTSLRSQAGAQLAVTTGMRLGEFSTLLDVEIPSSIDSGGSLLLEACAKYQKRRRVHIPLTTLRAVDLYRQTERRAVVRASAASLWRRRAELFIVDEIDMSAGVVRGRVDGRRSRWRLHQLPPRLRRIAVTERNEGLEALGLFVGRGGLPISRRQWHATFEAASRRTLDLAQAEMGGRRVRITPHDLRHTFAVVLLKSLTEVALAREAERRAGNVGPSTLSEHISINPRLTVQRLLGHSNPATTMVYLRYVEDTDALIQDVFESWSDEAMTFADAVLADRNAA